MRTILLISFVLMVGCTSDPSDPTDTGTSDVPTADLGTDTSTTDAADASGGDVAVSFCAATQCSGATPQCSELLQRCVECTANADCVTAPRLTCETFGDGASDPLYECVECVDDSVCGGGTCDLATHECVA